MAEELHAALRGWWRITETSQWVNDGLDDLGPAMLSITGRGDRLRMHCLLAYVNWHPTKTGASFTWEGAWEYRVGRKRVFTSHHVHDRTTVQLYYGKG